MQSILIYQNGCKITPNPNITISDSRPFFFDNRSNPAEPPLSVTPCGIPPCSRRLPHRQKAVVPSSCFRLSHPFRSKKAPGSYFPRASSLSQKQSYIHCMEYMNQSSDKVRIKYTHKILSLSVIPSSGYMAKFPFPKSTTKVFVSCVINLG